VTDLLKETFKMKPNKLATFLIVAVALLILPLLLQQGGNA
jgi:branched-chain amino acid transport system permease protein